VQIVQQIDALDGSIDGLIKMPADHVIFLTEGFFLNRIVENKHTPYSSSIARMFFFSTFQRSLEMYPFWTKNAHLVMANASIQYF